MEAVDVDWLLILSRNDFKGSLTAQITFNLESIPFSVKQREKQFTTDNQLNAKPVVKQRHPGDEFPVSQRGSTKGKQNRKARFKSR